MSVADRSRSMPAVGVIAVAALLAVLPLLVWGCSCGHDFAFHLQSWLEASSQWRHGIVRPVWAFSAAWNAGEPRLLLYPPLSWVIGAVLTLVLPFAWVPVAFTGIALLLSGVTMRRLLRRWMGDGAATAGACLYMVNPYMLFAAYERTAYAELLAAAWMPLLLAALLRPRPSVWRVAVPVALLWMTNAPAAVVGSYTVLVVALVRLILLRKDHQAVMRYACTVTAGVALGMLLDAFYLVPTIVERKLVQIALAVVVEMRPQDNFLFAHTPDADHDVVLAQASRIAVAVLATALLAAAALWMRRGRAVPMRSMHDRDGERQHAPQIRLAMPPLAIYSVVVLFLLLRASAPVWRVAPELAFLQFPWRFLAVESGVAVVLLLFALEPLTARVSRRVVLAGGLVAAAALPLAFHHFYGQGCDPEDRPEARLAAFRSGQGVDATDEYTPNDADNDVTGHDLPPAWVGAAAEAAPGAAAGVAVDASRPEDRFYRVSVAAPADLIVRMRAFAGWHVLLDGAEVRDLPERPDGLTAVLLPTAGPHTVELHYRATADQWAGDGLSLVGLGLFAVVAWRRL